VTNFLAPGLVFRVDVGPQSAKAGFPMFQPPVSTGGQLRIPAATPRCVSCRDARVGVREADFGPLLLRIHPPVQPFPARPSPSQLCSSSPP